MSLIRAILENEEGLESRLFSFSRTPAADGSRSQNEVIQIGTALIDKVITASTHPVEFCYLVAGLSRFPNYAEATGNSYLELVESLLQACTEQPEVGARVLQKGHGALNTVTRQYANSSCRLSVSDLVHATRATRFLQGFLAAYHAYSNSQNVLAQHADFLLVALKAKQYKRAGQILGALDFTIEHKFSVDYSDLLVLLNYASLVYTGLKEFERALEVLYRAFGLLSRLGRHEVQSAIGIVSTCFKRFLLLSLLVSGRLCSLPRGLPQELTSSLGQLNNEYLLLADAFRSHRTALLSTIIATHHSTFARDRNLGLIQQCAMRLPAFYVIDRTRAFINQPLARLGRDTELPTTDIEKLIVRLIDRKTLAASISQRDALVNFAHQSFDPNANPDRVSALLATKLQETTSTAIACRKLDASLALDQRIVKFELKKEFSALPQAFPGSSSGLGQDSASLLGGLGGLGGIGGMGGIGGGDVIDITSLGALGGILGIGEEGIDFDD